MPARRYGYGPILSLQVTPAAQVEGWSLTDMVKAARARRMKRSRVLASSFATALDVGVLEVRYRRRDGTWQCPGGGGRLGRGGDGGLEESGKGPLVCVRVHGVRDLEKRVRRATETDAPVRTLAV